MTSHWRALTALFVATAALTGCAVDSGSGSTPAPTMTRSATEVADSPVLSAIVLGGDHWEVWDDEGTVVHSMAYTEPATEALEVLTEALGRDYTLTDYDADDGCGQSPARIYEWAGGSFSLSDRTGLSADAPYDLLHYSIAVSAATVDGVSVTSQTGVSVGGDVSALPASNDPNNRTGVILLESGGTYQRILPDGSSVALQWGLHVSSPSDPQVVEHMLSSSTGREFFC